MQKETDGWYSEHVSILVTAPYFENLQLRLAPRRDPLADGRDGLTFYLPLGEGKYPLISLYDIAWFSVFMFENWQSWGARDLAVIGDSLTGAEIAASFERVSGVPSAYASVSLDMVRASIPGVGHDLAAMMQFFQERDLFTRDRDIAKLRSVHPGLMTFEDWLRVTQWDGKEKEIQKYPVRFFEK